MMTPQARREHCKWQNNEDCTNWTTWIPSQPLKHSFDVYLIPVVSEELCLQRPLNCLNSTIDDFTGLENQLISNKALCPHACSYDSSLTCQVRLLEHLLWWGMLKHHIMKPPVVWKAQPLCNCEQTPTEVNIAQAWSEFAEAFVVHAKGGRTWLLWTSLSAIFQRLPHQVGQILSEVYE